MTKPKRSPGRPPAEEPTFAEPEPNEEPLQFRSMGPITLPSLPRIYNSHEAVTYYQGRLRLGRTVIASRRSRE